MCNNLQVDRSRGYNRAARKLLHIAGGLFALTLPLIPYWLALAAATSGVVLAYWLKPHNAWWLRYISKPADRNRGVITGLRGYTMVILLLVLLWPLMGLARGDAVRYIMFGWLALAWGDGLAGLVGPGPSVARTVPWSKQKTWWGMVGGYFGVVAAYYLSFLLPVAGVPTVSLAAAAGIGPVLAAVTALLESLDTELDDNWLVGLGAPLIAWGLHLTLG